MQSPFAVLADQIYKHPKIVAIAVILFMILMFYGASMTYMKTGTETYVDIGWISMFIPFTSGFSPTMVGIGTLAFDAFVAVLVTSIMRDRIDEGRWRQVHWLSYGLWALAIVHGVGLGTSNEPLLRGITILCGIVGGVAIYRHIRMRDDHEDERRRIAAQEWS